jgi:RNA polymerase sigma factor (TIGR02999 family)
MASDPRDHVTAVLSRCDAAEGPVDELSGAAAEELMPVVYDELRRLAGGIMRRERAGHTLDATGLVHEAWMRLVHQDRVRWRGRRHFFAVAAQVMRRLLVDHARRRDANKRGGELAKVTLEGAEALLGQALPPEELLTLDAALGRLAAFDPRGAEVVSLRFFAGLEVTEVAELLGVSRRTVEGDWTHARAWLRRELAGAGAAGPT